LPDQELGNPDNMVEAPEGFANTEISGNDTPFTNREILVNLKPKNTIANKVEPTTVDNILKPANELDALQPAMAYAGMRTFIKRSGLKLLSPFKNAKLNLSRTENKNKPALNISFTSDAYYASAILHLR
jgi:hypothetical protein